MLKQVFIAGATGYTGRVLAPLIAQSTEWKPLAHVRPGSRHVEALPAEIERREVDLADTTALISAMAGCEAAVSLIGTTRAQFGPGVSYETVDIGTTQLLVTAAKQAGIKRFVLLSSVGASETGVAYLRAKAAAEKIVMNSGLDWIILRPSAIVGPGRQLPRLLTPLALVLHYVPGLRRIIDDYRPVHVETLARAIFAAAKHSPVSGEVWHGKMIWGK
jgi:NADH dehydrogenase